LTGLKTSPGNAPIPSHLYLPHLLVYLPCKYWALVVFAILPNIPASYVISFRQASVLSWASFRHPLTGLPLPLTNTSPYRAYEGLAPSSISALPGAQNKNLPF